MSTGEAPKLSLSEWVVLCAVCEKPTHGFAVTALLSAQGSLGRIWRVPKPVIYRVIARLECSGLIRTTGQEHSTHGPVRSRLTATAAGRRAAAQWLSTPAGHARDIRSELLVKLALLDRAGADTKALLVAQQTQLAPIAAALASRVRETTGFDHTLALWRHETMTATMGFLTAITPAD